MLTSFFAGIFLYVLLILYQPFGTSQFEHPYKYLLLLPYALISAISFFIVNKVIQNGKFNWTIGSELLKIGIIFLLISTLSYCYNTFFLSRVRFSFENLLYMFFYTFALGVPTAIIYFLARYIYYFQNDKSESITVQLNEFKIKDNQLAEISVFNANRFTILSDYGTHHLDLEESDFIYAEAADNYCIIYYLKYGIIKKEMIRISLTHLVSQIETNSIKRVHRSFVVNLNKVIAHQGNKAGYKFSLMDVEKEFTISRNYIDSIIPILKYIVNRH